MEMNTLSASVCCSHLHVLMVFCDNWDELISMYKSHSPDHCTIPSESKLISLNDPEYVSALKSLALRKRYDNEKWMEEADLIHRDERFLCS